MATLDVLFQKPDGQEEVKTFTTRPLGMEFLKRMPIVVTQTKFESAELGVQNGWTIKGVGGESFDTMDFCSAFACFQQAIAPLRQDLVVRDCPLTGSSVAALVAKVGPVNDAEVPNYLKRFGYAASKHDAWENSTEGPEIHLGVIDGHTEKGTPYTHTWYALQCRLTPRQAGGAPIRWQVERRLAHLRACCHDPVKRELGKGYDAAFAGAHFAHHGGPPGTTNRLEGWLEALSKLFNERKLTPGLLASLLRFLEVPDLSEVSAAGSSPAASGPSPASNAAPLGGEKEVSSPKAPAASAPEREADEKTDDGNSDAGEGREAQGEEGDSRSSWHDLLEAEARARSLASA